MRFAGGQGGQKAVARLRNLDPRCALARSRIGQFRRPEHLQKFEDGLRKADFAGMTSNVDLWHFSDLANESSVGPLCGVKRTYPD